MSHKYVYLFKEGNAKMRNLLGGKGANLAEMTSLNLPVPQGFTVTTEACTAYYANNKEIPAEILEQIDAALAGGADTIMLDNFSLEDTRRGVERIAGRAIVEASGNMTLERVPQVAATGVDVISVGALTHSVSAIDLGLDWD